RSGRTDDDRVIGQDAPDFDREAAGRRPPDCIVRLRLVEEFDRQLFRIEESDTLLDRLPKLGKVRFGSAKLALEYVAGVKVERNGVIQTEEQDDLFEHIVEIGFALRR